MTLPIFLDTNIPIYAAGRPHPLQAPCRRILTLVASHPTAFFTDAEVLQELLHRYLRLGAWSQGSIVLGHFAVLMQARIEPVYAEDVEAAATAAAHISVRDGRDLLHAAIIRRIGGDSIVSSDRDFDRFSPLAPTQPR